MAEDAKWKKYSRRWEKKAREYKQKNDELESKLNAINQEHDTLKKELNSTKEERDKVRQKGDFGPVALAAILILGVLFIGSVAGLALLYNTNLELTSSNADLSVEISSLRGQLTRLQYEKSALEDERREYLSELTDIEKELEKVKGDSDATIRLLQRELLSLTNKVSRLESDIRAKDASISSLQRKLYECERSVRCFNITVTPTSRTSTTGTSETLNYTLNVNFPGYVCRTIQVPLTLRYDFNVSGDDIDRFTLSTSSAQWCCN